MRGNRRLRGARIATRLVRARNKPRRSTSPRRGRWRLAFDPDTLSDRAMLFDDESAEDSPGKGEPSDD